MSLAAVAVRNQRRRAAQQQTLLADEATTQKSNSLDASDPNLKLRKVRQLSQAREGCVQWERCRPAGSCLQSR